MKKILVVTLFLIFCSAPFTVMAQNSAVDKGSIELGIGNIIDIQLSRSPNYLNENWIMIGYTPDLTAGYFVINGLMVGTTIGYGWYKSETMTESDNYLLVQPLVKYYFPISEKVLINGKVFFGWVRNKDAGDPDTYTRMRFGAGGAATYMLLPSLGASLGVDIFIFPDRKISGTTIDNSSFNVFNILIGLTAYL